MVLFSGIGIIASILILLKGFIEITPKRKVNKEVYERHSSIKRHQSLRKAS
jgi:hypothetical protein